MKKFIVFFTIFSLVFVIFPALVYAACFGEDQHLKPICSSTGGAGDYYYDSSRSSADPYQDARTPRQIPVDQACFSEDGYFIMFCDRNRMTPRPYDPTPPPPPPPPAQHDPSFGDQRTKCIKDGYYIDCDRPYHPTPPPPPQDPSPTSRACYSEDGYFIMFCDRGRAPAAPSPPPPRDPTPPPPAQSPPRPSSSTSSACFSPEGYYVPYCL